MSVGHGAMGFLSALRGYPELVDEDEADRRPYIELRLGKEMAAGSWLAVGGSPGLYRQRCHIVLGGELRDVVGVTYETPGTLGTTSLTRAESLAACAATAGTFYFSGEDAAILGAPAWDDTAAAWDALSPFWDIYPPAELYVHLAADADPNSQIVVALLGFYFSGGGSAPSEAHPTLGTNLLANAGFETWNSATDAASWTETVPSGCSVTRESSIVRGGSFSAKLTTDGFGTVKEAQDVTLIPGRRYRLAAWYETPASNSGAFVARILVGSGASYLLSNGRDYGTSGTPPQPSPSGGEFRRLLFDFIAPTTTVTFSFEALGGAGTIYLDDLELRRIFRFNPYDARLASDSVPEVMTQIGWLLGSQTVGLASVSVLNGDGSGNGYFETIFGQLLTTRKPLFLSAGGVFKDGSEVYRDGWQARFGGLVEDVEIEDGRALLRLADARTFLQKQVPAEKYDSLTYPNMDNRRGGPRPIVIGRSPCEFASSPISGASSYWIRPVRVDKDAVTGFGVYELANMAIAVNGLNNNDNLGTTNGPICSSCRNEESMRRAEGGLTFFGNDGVNASFNASAGRLSILSDVSFPIGTPFVDADHNHFIICIARGYIDDASGTYTGVANAVIEKPPHVARFLMRRLLGLPSDSFAADFDTTSDSSGYPLFAYLDDERPLDEILAAIERSAMAVIVADGSGVFHWVPYNDATSRRTFYDRDYLSFKCTRPRTAVYAGLNMTFPYFSRDGNGMEAGVIARSVPGVGARYGVSDVLTVGTFLQHAPDPTSYTDLPTMPLIQGMADRYVKLISSSPRQAEFTAKGKLSDLKVADIITLNRSRALDATGALANVKFRIVGLGFNDASGISRCTAMEYISVP